MNIPTSMGLSSLTDIPVRFPGTDFLFGGQNNLAPGPSPLRLTSQEMDLILFSKFLLLLCHTLIMYKCFSAMLVKFEHMQKGCMVDVFDSTNTGLIKFL